MTNLEHKQNALIAYRIIVVAIVIGSIIYSFKVDNTAKKKAPERVRYGGGWVVEYYN